MILDDLELNELDKLADLRLSQPWGIQRGDDNANFDRMARLTKSAVGEIYTLRQTIIKMEALIDEYAAGRIIC